MQTLAILFLFLTAGLAVLAVLLLFGFWAMLEWPVETDDANLPPITHIR